MRRWIRLGKSWPKYRRNASSLNTGFREAKSECGMADYQVRRWDAWHHHVTLVMLGTLFLVKQKKAGRQQWPLVSFNDLVTALERLLPRRQLTAEE